jgi:hypothetical protein
MTLKFDVETNGVRYKLIITEGATRTEVVGTKAEMRRLMIDLYHETVDKDDVDEWGDLPADKAENEEGR